eukprot:Gb_38828 [translate_table: standard]
MEMDSPDRNQNTPSSALQGSPFFNYLCNLSPIKPVKSVHVAQTFSELNFPPPPAVFTSPRVASQKESSLLKRSSHKDTVDEENKIFSNSSCDKGKEFTVALSDCDMSASLSSAVGQVTSFETLASDQTKCEDKSTSTFPGCSPSRYVEQYLADPVEEEHYTVDSSEQYSKSTSPVLDKDSIVDFDKPQDITTNQSSRTNETEMVLQSKSSEEFVGANKTAAESEMPQAIEECCFAENSEEAMKSLDVRKPGHDDEHISENMASVWSDVVVDQSHTCMFAKHSVSSQTGANHDQNLVDQTTSAFAFLLSKCPTDDIEEWQKAPSSDCSKILFQQDPKDPLKHPDVSGQHGDLDSTPQPLHDSFQDTKPGADLHAKVDMESNRPMEHQISFGCKASNQLQRGMRRRCLDFEASEARKKSLGNSSWKPTNLMSRTGVLVSAAHESETNNSSSILCERAVTSDCKQLVPLKREINADTGRCSQSLFTGKFSSCSYQTPEFTSDKVDSSVRSNVNSPLSASMPSGIGLHLNSLATSMSLSCGVSVLTSAKGSLSMQGVVPLSGVKEASSDGLGSCLQSGNSGVSVSVGSSANLAPGMVVSVVEKTRMDQQELQSSGTAQIGVTKSTTCFRSLTVGIKPLQSRLPLKAEERNLSPLGKKRPVIQDISRQPAFGMGEEFNQSSPKKKRRKSATITDKEGCKRCNCKKSKCLKLYCECFAAGVYCVEPCTCQECFNKPEYEDMVLGTRQTIESRNPLAFAPKIVRSADSPPTNGEEFSETPASARHKRGCNCKKSMCLKKYCECYQAGVGCSDGCRCEGCKNMYGKKEAGSDEIEDKETQDEGCDKESSEEKVEVLEVGNDILHPEQHHSKDLSPITPSFQCAGQGRTTVKLKSSGKRRFASEDLESPTISQPCAKPPRSPGKIPRSTKGLQGNATAIHNYQGVKSSASLIYTPKMEKSGQFSPRWDGLGDICTLTPMAQPPSRPAAASVAMVDGVEVSPFSGKQNEISSSSNGPLVSRHSCPVSSSPVFRQPAARSPVCTSDSLHWQTPVNARTTPVTPALTSSVCNVGNKLAVGSDFDIHSHNISSSAEDDTPEILKDNCSPIRMLKASSPNQKRVSPPHNYCPKEMTSRGLMSSPGLRSGRKFILQSVPSFPPLTPSFSAGEGQGNNISRTE